MNKILKANEAIEVAQKLRKQKRTIVVVGGFFDILHVGHIKFLTNARQFGDYLFLLLEEDEASAKKKGENRPINTQRKRAAVLASLSNVNFIVLLKKMTNNDNYDSIISQIRPSVIATTYPDPAIEHKIRQAKLVNGKVEYVIKRISEYSTTRLANLIERMDI